MKLVEANWAPTDRQLRQFGGVCLIALPLAGWLWGAAFPTMAWLAVVGLVIAVAGLCLPKAIKPLFLALTLVALPIGMLIGEVAMLLVYFGVFLPIGLLFRITGRDALQLKFDRDSPTYWQPKKRPKRAESYYRQS
jgi:hypothetical protein